MKTLFFMINEDGVVYQIHTTFTEALETLTEFPNDTVTIAITGSPIAARLTSQYRLDYMQSA